MGVASRLWVVAADLAVAVASGACAGAGVAPDRHDAVHQRGPAGRRIIGVEVSVVRQDSKLVFLSAGFDTNGSMYYLDIEDPSYKFCMMSGAACTATSAP